MLYLLVPKQYFTWVRCRICLSYEYSHMGWVLECASGEHSGDVVCFMDVDEESLIHYEGLSRATASYLTHKKL